jgi:hypothetical protein
MKSILQNILFFLLLFSWFGCKKTNETTFEYVGTHNNLQASMSVVFFDHTFNGTYIIEYTDKKKDSGTINGEIKDNIWLGKYNYVSRNGDRKIKPIAFVLKNNRIIRG